MATLVQKREKFESVTCRSIEGEGHVKSVILYALVGPEPDKHLTVGAGRQDET